MAHREAIDGELIYKMLLGGFHSLSLNKNYLDAINVFPVSDGDTGTNMKNTFGTGVSALKETFSFDSTFSAFVKGMLTGSRGNSGFILSQYFLGIYEYTKDKPAVTVPELSAALQNAYQVAYQSVLYPVDGTMLTIMREGIKATEAKTDEGSTLKEFFSILVSEMYSCVLKTIKQMDLLSDNNVLDSGALGLFLIFDGMQKALCEDTSCFDCQQSQDLPVRSQTLVKNVSFFRFCTQFFLRLKEQKSKDYFTRLLADKGDSIAVAINEGILNVHLHTNRPQEVTGIFAKFGDIAVTKIDDLFNTEEFERLSQRKHGGYVVVAFTKGKGCVNITEQMGADVAFDVPPDYRVCEEDIKRLLEGFLKENLIVFPHDTEMYNQLKSFQWYHNHQNLYVADTDGLVKTFYTLSTLVFTDPFREVVRSVDAFRNRNIMRVGIRVSVCGRYTQFTGYLPDQCLTEYSLIELMAAIDAKKPFGSYSTIIIFIGEHARPEDVTAAQAYLYRKPDTDVLVYEGLQTDFDLIIGAF